MAIYTCSYFTLPKDLDCVRVQISNSKPEWFRVDAKFDQLIPNWEWVEEYKRTGDLATFTRRYRYKLSAYPPEALKAALESLGKTVVLLCWETKNFCHRSVLGEYINVEELKL